MLCDNAWRAAPMTTADQVCHLSVTQHLPRHSKSAPRQVKRRVRAAATDADDEDAPAPGKPMRVERLLANLGYATRKDCQAMIKKGRVLGAGGARLKVGDKVLHQDVTVDGEPLDPPFPLTLILHKPVGYVSTSPDDKGVVDPTIYDLLPQRYGSRKPFLSSVGRLDKDTSGLLLLTDDGQLLHKIKSPKQSIWKVYIARLARLMSPEEVTKATKKFASGTLLLPGELQPLLPAKLTMRDSQTAVVSVVEGRYHQVRRMFRAVGNEVVTLHRVSIGALTLPDDVARGEYRTITAEEMERVFQQQAADEAPSSSQGQDDTRQSRDQNTPHTHDTPATTARQHRSTQDHGPDTSQSHPEQATQSQQQVPIQQRDEDDDGGGDNGSEDGAGDRSGVPAARRLRRVNAFRRRVAGGPSRDSSRDASPVGL